MRLLSIAIFGMALTGTALAGTGYGDGGIGEDQPNRPEEGPGQGGQVGQGDDRVQPEPGRGQDGRGQYECAQVDQQVLRATWELRDFALHMQEVANLAAKNGSQEIQQLASEMGEGYGQLVQDIEQWAEGQQIEFGQTPPGVYTGQIDNLSNLSGQRFDRAFMRLVREENQRVLDDINALDVASLDEDFANQLEEATQLFERYIAEVGKGDGMQRPGDNVPRPGDDDGGFLDDLFGGDGKDDQGRGQENY